MGLGLLEEQRDFTRLKPGDILLGDIESGGCAHKCGWTSKYAYAYLKSLRNHRLWPTGLSNISEAIERVGSMPDPIPDERNTSCTYEYKHTAADYRRRRQWLVDDLRENVGLCLHCTRMENSKSTHCHRSH